MHRFAVIALLVLPTPGRSAAAQADPYVGTFSNGVLTLRLEGTGGRYQGTAGIQGRQFPLSAERTAKGLRGTYADNGTAYPWTAVLQGDVLVMSVDGTTVQLQRQGGTGQAAAPQPGPAPGSPAGDGTTPLSAIGREWHTWLAGKRVTHIESYSSYDGTGGGGGYSAREVWDFCSNGQFYYAGSNSVSVDVGSSASSGGANQGTGSWRIIEQGQLVGLELRWTNGNVTQHLLQFQDGATYADGERVYVTEDNASCR